MTLTPEQQRIALHCAEVAARHFLEQSSACLNEDRRALAATLGRMHDEARELALSIREHGTPA